MLIYRHFRAALGTTEREAGERRGRWRAKPVGGGIPECNLKAASALSG